MRATTLVVLLLTVGSNALAAAAQEVAFIACPIYRDTDAGRKSGCWLADDHSDGVRYDVSAAPMKPQLGHPVLVEGVVSGDADACGGVTLRPVRTSQLEGTCEGIIIPAENFPGRRFNLPPDALRPIWEARETPPPPYAARDYYILFDLHSGFLVYQHSEIILDKVITYAKASKAKQIQVTGFATVAPLYVSGQSFREDRALARQRAETVSEALRRLGVDPAIIRTAWRVDAQPVVSDAASTPETSKRRVTIRVVPGD